MANAQKRKKLMKGSVGSIIAIIIFFTFLALLSSTFIFDSSKYPSSAFVNQTSGNTTIITIGGETDVSQVQLCDFHVDIPVLGGLIWGADCIADYVGYLFGFAGTNSNVQWLQYIIIAIIAGLILIAVALLRGTNISR